MHERFPMLVVDDDPAVADVLSRAASQLFPQAEFIPVSSFSQAAAYLDDLTGYGPRLILLDLDLASEQTGLDFLDKVRAHPQGLYLPVIVLTGNQSSQKMIDAYLRKANSVTVKPFSYSDWKSYVSMLKAYWYEVVTLPNVWFEKESDNSNQ